MQTHLKQLMKNLVYYLLDQNMYIRRSNTAERSQFYYVIETIKYYWPVRPPTLMKFIFYWLTGLSPLIEPPTDLDRTKSKYYSENNKINA